MINSNNLECLTCGERARTRVAIGHGERQEFAFPCLKCGVEIRLVMKIDQKAVKYNYEPLKGAKWISEGVFPEPKHLNLDGESLVPLNLLHLSPFLANSFLPSDLERYHTDRLIRFDLSVEVWPLFKQLLVHRDNKNDLLFDKVAVKLGFEGIFNDWDDRLEFELSILKKLTVIFHPFTAQEEVLVRQRIKDAEVKIGNDTPQLIQSLDTTYSNALMTDEIQRNRNNFMQLFPAISGLYVSLYWDSTKHSLDDYQLAQKRFDELKMLYVECFETLCRLSVIAATLEGVIQLGIPEVPKARGSMTSTAFLTMPNGSKPDILKNFPIRDIFVPALNSKLRNGVGHNSAYYNVTRDEVIYSNHSATGIQNFQMSYIRFCEEMLRIYSMFEVATLYADWLRAKLYGLKSYTV